MGKRSDFERAPRDFYPTPYEAVIPLLPHLSPNTAYYEPCAGDGALIGHLAKHGHSAVWSMDIEPRADWIAYGDATEIETGNAVFSFITNPPWDRKILHPIIANLCRQHPTWLLFDADWLHTKQSAPFMSWLRKIVSVGRVKWVPDSKMTGKDNCCWYLFDAQGNGPTEFIGR